MVREKGFRKKYLHRFKSFFAWSMVFFMLFSILPWSDLIVHGAPGDFDPATSVLSRVIVGKTYDSNSNLEKVYITLIGSNLRGVDVAIIRYGSGATSLNAYRTSSSGASLQQFEVSAGQIGNPADFLGEFLLIGGALIELNEGEFPIVSDSKRRVKANTPDTDPDNAGTLTLTGSRLDSIGTTIIGQYGRETLTPFPTPLIPSGPTSVSFANLPGLGMQNINFSKNENVSYEFPGGTSGTVDLTIEHTYLNQFRLYEDLNITGIRMVPNRGSVGDRVYFYAETLGDYAVYFLKDETDPYTTANRGTDSIYTPVTGGDDILTVRVPAGLAVGSYTIMLTNATIGDPATTISREFRVPEQFTVIDASQKMSINRPQPDTGPDTGIITTITGRYIGTMNELNTEYIKGTGTETITYKDGTQTMVVKYPDGTYRGQDATAEREIKVYIGAVATFESTPAPTFTPVLDSLTVRTPTVNDAATNPYKTVVVETVTTIKSAVSPFNTLAVISERAELPLGFEYIPSTVQPTIESITPDKIQVFGSLPPYEVPAGRMIAIHGANFMIHRYYQGATEVVRYPVIQLGELVLDKNQNPALSVRIYDAQGNELDGTSGKELGTKILILLPEGEEINTLGLAALTVTNPARNSEDPGLSHTQPNFIEFVSVDVDKNPVITTVTPDTVAVEGGEQIVIEGSNFLNGVRVFIHGEEVTNIVRQEDARRITFTAPPGREGETLLTVMNPEGGAATHPFTYVITYTNPRITSFAPRTGSTGTLVIVNGQNFLKPDPTASRDSIYRLIGTRVLLGNEDINEYNLNATTKRIELLPYSFPAAKPLLSLADGELQISEDYSAIILSHGTPPSERFYTLDVNARGELILSDGITGSYIITPDLNGTGFSAGLIGGGTFPLSIYDDKLVINEGQPTELELTFHTPYQVDVSGDIVGNRVRVTTSGEIFFRVPGLPAEGYYDVTVVNPDTKKDSRVGQQGFYYYRQPQSRPRIDSVNPSEGSVSGGYNITIYGAEFEDDGTNKSRVFINGIEVAAADTMVGVDGRSITVLVPAYPGSLVQDRGTSRLEVPIVIINTDGGSASNEKAFTYVVPTSNPSITRIILNAGSAAGGEIVEIIGTDFRYFEPYEDLNFNQQWDPGEPFHDLYANGTWDDYRRGANESLEDYQSRLNELKEALLHPQFDYYYDSPVLPKVFFGNQQARIVDFAAGYIKVITPPGAAGNAQVYVLNGDAGLSNKVTYTYRSSSPVIQRIIPNQGDRAGGDRVEILGSGFAYSEMQIYRNALDGSGNTVYELVTQPRIRFGNITNRNIAYGQDNYGLINNGRATVNLAGGLQLMYNAGNQNIYLQIEANGKIYATTIQGYDNTVKYIPVSLLTTADGESYPGSELIRVEVSDRRFIVERGYAVSTQLVNPTQIMLYTPSYYTVGQVGVYLMNPDGGQAQGTFEYKNPDSVPTITNITKEGIDPVQMVVDGETVLVQRMTHKGGNLISIIGTDFREGAQIQISNLVTIPTADINYQLPTRLTFEMPNVGEAAMGRLHRVVVTNTDGGAAYSDILTPPIYIEFIKGETEPQITKVTPEIGSVAGGTRLTIEGSDFRETITGFEGNDLKVFLGETKVPAIDVEFIDYRTIRVTVPESTQYGVVDVKIENPDGELAILRQAFTYVSLPEIDTVFPGKMLANDANAEITLTGAMFIAGAKVVLGGTILQEGDVTEGMTVQGTGIQGVDSSGNNIHVAVVGGILASSVVVQDETTMVIKFGESLDLENNHLIIINPDGGISDPFRNFDYVIPVPNKPLVLEAIPGAESSVTLIWSDSDKDLLNRADRFEIYGKKTSDREYTYVGDTRAYEFVVQGLQVNTQYSFMVRAMNEYGSALQYAEATVRTFSEREDQQLQDKLDAMDKADQQISKEGKIQFINGAVVRTIGLEEIPRGANPYVIDFSLTQYKNQSRYIVAIPLSLTESLNSNLKITDGTVEFTVLVTDLFTREAAAVSQADRSDTYVQVILERLTGSTAESMRAAVARNQIRASEIYDIDFQLQVKTTTRAISSMLRPGQLRLNHDTMTYGAAAGRSLFVGQYDAAKHAFNKAADGQSFGVRQKGRYVLLAQR